MKSNQAIFVTGGTGKQGGAVVKHLLRHGFALKVLTRNADAAEAQALKQPSVQLVQGDLDDPDTYREHLQGCYGVFSVQAFEGGAEKETRQGIGLATLAQEAGVAHFLYSSVAGAGGPTGVPHIDSKRDIERHLKQLGLPFTIIRPTSFYENFLLPQVRKGIGKGRLTQPTKPGTVLQYVGTDDIGRAAATIFLHPERYLGKTLTLANEQLSTQQVADLFSRSLNRPVVYQQMPALLTRLFLGKGLYKMFKWMDEEQRVLAADVVATQYEFSPLQGLGTWIKSNFRAA